MPVTPIFVPSCFRKFAELRGKMAVTHDDLKAHLNTVLTSSLRMKKEYIVIPQYVAWFPWIASLPEVHETDPFTTLQMDLTSEKSASRKKRSSNDDDEHSLSHVVQHPDIPMECAAVLQPLHWLEMRSSRLVTR